MTVWDATRTERLKTLWALGWSAARIAADLGCFQNCNDGGRSAVIGKIHRLGLAPPQTKESHRGNGRQKSYTAKETAAVPSAPQSAAPKPPCRASEPVPDHPASEKPDRMGIPFAALSDINCHWPMGDPGQADFKFCGRPALTGQPYCADHCRIAYAPVPERRSISRAY